MKRFEKALAISLEVLAGATCATTGVLMQYADAFALLFVPAAMLGGAGLVLWGRNAHPAIPPQPGPKQLLDEPATLQQEVASLQAEVAAFREEREFLAQLYSGERRPVSTSESISGGA